MLSLGRQFNIFSGSINKTIVNHFASSSRKSKRLIKPAQPSPIRRHGKASKLNNKLHDKSIDEQGKTYRIIIAGVLERLPLILPPKEDWENDYDRMKHELELRYAKRVPEDFWFREPGEVLLKPEEVPYEADDYIEEDLTIGAGFKVAPRVTEDDLKNNRHSLNRALSKRLFLIVKGQNPAESVETKFSNQWFFPTTEIFQDEKMKFAAARQMVDVCGDEIEIYPLGNAPFATISYSDQEENDKYQVDGTKIFFFKSLYWKGAMQFDNKYAQDYLWVTREELSEYMDESIAEKMKLMVPP